jgi:copper transport protein
VRDVYAVVRHARWFRAALLLVGLLALWSWIAVDQTGAHAFLERSDPPAQAILPASPERVLLWFTEDLESSAVSARLLDQTGQEVPGTSYAVGEPDQLIVTLPGGLPNGTYSVVWRNVSTEDGHPITGYVPFTVGTAADVTEVVAPVDGSESGGAPQWQRTTARWLAFLGLFGAVAVWPVWSLVMAPSLRRRPGLLGAALPAASVFGTAAITLSLVGNVIALLVQAVDVGGGSGDAFFSTLGDTRYGTLMIWRFALLTMLALLLSVANWHDPLNRPVVTTLGIITSLVLVAPFSLNAHAAAQGDGRAMAVASDMVHLASAAIWAGGAALLLAVLVRLWRHRPPDVVRTGMAMVVPRFSALAIAAWICLTATGIYGAWLQAGGLDALRETAYGRALLVKLVIAVLLLALGAWHLIRLTRRIVRQTPAGLHATDRFRRSLGLEVALVIAILLVTGWMTSEPPAREALAAEQAPAPGVTLDLQANGIDGQLSITPGAVGPNIIRLQLPVGAAPADAEVLLRLTGPDPSMGEEEITLAPAGDGVWTVSGSHFSVSGEWAVTAIVRKVGEFQWQASDRVTIALAASGANVSSGVTYWHLTDRAIIGLVALIAGAVVTGYLLALRSRERVAAPGG